MVPRNGEPVVADGLLTRLRKLFGSSAPPLVANTATVTDAKVGGGVKSENAEPKAEAKAEAKPEDDMVAIKCNLCEHTGLNPPGAKRPAYSCEENCPTGALVRVDPQEYFDEVGKTVGLVFRDETHAIGRNIHKSDRTAKAWHVLGSLAVIAITAWIIWAARRYGFNQSLRGSWLTMRWVTGLVGLGGIAVVMTYPVRKPIYRRRAGALRYWLLAHLYFGALAGVVLLIHGASHGGSLLTATLMFSFDAVILTGLFGLAAYLVAPRILTSIEGDPLLIEDLEGRRDELRGELKELREKADSRLQQLIDNKIHRHFFSPGYLIRQYLRREPLTAAFAKARLHFRNDITNFEEKEKRALALRVVERMATLRRVDALIYLHRLMKIWVTPHVVTTTIMLVLMIAHIVQVVFFSVR
jgi:hypothetical protein